MTLKAGSVSLMEVRRDSLAFLVERATASPDGFSYVVDGDPVHVVNTPDLVARVLRTDVRAFSKKGTPDDLMLSPVLGQGLLTTSGDLWARQRQAMAPLFRRSAIVGYDRVITAAAEATAREWLDRGTGLARRDHDLSTLTLGVLTGALFGPDAGRIGPNFGAAVDDVNHYLGAFGGDTDVPEAQRLSEDYTRAVRLIRSISGALLMAFRLDPREGAMLRRMLDAEGIGAMLDQVITLIMAGHETTAKLMCWALLLLADDAEAQDRARAEVRECAGDGDLRAEHVGSMPFLGAVVQEVMRLYPPIWLMSRRALEPMRLGELDVSEGELVCLPQWLVHRDARWWSDPEEFTPERFLDGQPRPFTYFPFGGGDRICIGQHLAVLEAVLGLGTLLRTCRFSRPADRFPAPEALVTLRPRDGAMLRVDPVAGA